MCVYVCLCVRVCPHQHRVLHIVTKQPRIVERVLGLLHLGIHGALLHLMLQGLEELVERLSSRVLGEHGGTWRNFGVTRNVSVLKLKLKILTISIKQKNYFGKICQISQR